MLKIIWQTTFIVEVERDIVYFLRLCLNNLTVLGSRKIGIFYKSVLSKVRNYILFCICNICIHLTFRMYRYEFIQQSDVIYNTCRNWCTLQFIDKWKWEISTLHHNPYKIYNKIYNPHKICVLHKKEKAC